MLFSKFLMILAILDTVIAIRIATYNLWNIMFNWEVRKLRISQMIIEADPDVIAFQEVRFNEDDQNTQLNDLQQLLPHYAYSAFHPVAKVEYIKDTYSTMWSREGIGLLSKIPLKNTVVQNLTHTTGPDSNRRIVLHAKFDAPAFDEINIAAVHFSYDRMQQCGNSVELHDYITEHKLMNVILLGDFNAYNDYPGPIDVFTNTKEALGKQSSSCFKIHKKKSRRPVHFSDALAQLYEHKKGYTFSNMPQPGLESRPDRILISPSFKVQSAQLIGDGKIYKNRYYFHILWQRFENVLRTAYDAHKGKTGRPCKHDCGPHASCRCGVCVSGGDKNTCQVPHCEECSMTIYTSFIVCLGIFILLLLQLVYGLLQVLQTLNKRGSYDLPRLFGCNCCLCNEELYSKMNTTFKRSRQFIVCRLWPLCSLPPMLLVFVTMLMFFMFIEILLYIFADSVNDIYSIIPEEMFPSDHRLLVIEVVRNRVA